MNALSQQIGGDHYKNLAIQPAEYCFRNNIGKLEGDVVAYVTRWKSKNGVEDLEKARHTLDILIELANRKPSEKPPISDELIDPAILNIGDWYEWKDRKVKQWSGPCQIASLNLVFPKKNEYRRCNPPKE